MANALVDKRSAAPRPRPRFDLLLAADPDDVFERLAKAIDTVPAVRGVALDARRFEIIRNDRASKIWAPQLDVKLIEVESGTKVMGRFGPHPHVWMMYLSIYMTLAFGATAFLVWGTVQWFLDESPWALYLTPLVLVGAGLAYGASYVGQGLATGQMYELREFLEENLEYSQAAAAVDDTAVEG